LEVLLVLSRTTAANPVGALWRVLKNQIAANLEHSLDTLKAACERFLGHLSPEGTLRKASPTVVS
jgi:hypothetical protein